MERDYCKFPSLSVGQIVRAKAGREKGLFMIVTEVIDEDFVLLSDGDHRKFISPKKKKIKHVLKTNTICSDIAASIEDGSVTDKRIREALSEFNYPNKEKGDQK